MKTISAIAPLSVVIAILLAGCAPMTTPEPAPSAAPLATPLAPAPGPLLVWQREGGIAGFCDRLTVSSGGDAVAESCKQGAGVIGRSSLDADQLALLEGWRADLAVVSYREADPATADAMTVTVSLQGSGRRQATEAEQQAIAQFAAALYASIGEAQVAPAPTEAPAESDQDAATRAAIVAAAGQLGVDPSAVGVVSVTPEEWSDSCLGYAASDEICLQVITPGFRIVVESGDRRLELHTDARGSVVRAAPETGDGGAAAAQSCAAGFVSHPLTGIGGTPSPVRSTLSDAELAEVLGEMGLASLCIPEEFGAPFVNVDWNAETFPGTKGRMLSLGFESLYEGAGWSDGYVLYSTYGFSTGSEYDTFARERDRDDLRRGLMENEIEVGGARGFIRYQLSLCYGSCTLYKVTVFPFDDHYIAIVIPVQSIGDGDDWEEIAGRIEAEGYPADVKAKAEAFDALAQSVRFAGRIPWSEARELVLSGAAKGVMQTHALEVTLTLADGSRVSTVEPAIDDIFALVDVCGQSCAGMSLATE